MSHPINEKGFTLIELIVTLALLGFIISALFTIYVKGLTSWQKSTNQMEYQQTARIAVDKIVNELRYAYELEIGPEPETIYFKTMRNGHLTLYRFRRAGSQLLYEIRDNYNQHYSTNVVALNISALSFTRSNQDLIFITLTAGSESEAVTLQSAIKPRNLSMEGP